MAEQQNDLGISEDELRELETDGQESPPEAPPPPPPPQEKLVPLQALHEARAEIRNMRQQLGNVDALRQEILAMREQQQRANMPPEPTFDTDPKAALERSFQRIEEGNRLRDQVLTEMVQERVVQQQNANFVNTVVAAEQQFRQVAPDYDEAINYLRDVRTRELHAVGVTDPTYINQELGRLAAQVAGMALQQGKNPPEIFYNLARTYGYAPRTMQPPVQKVPMPQAGSRFGAIQQGREAASTIQHGGQAEVEPSVKSLLEADGDDFDKQWDALFGRKGKRF